MGWGLRRSIRLGPFRVNLSKSGIGFSAGVRGLRVGRDSNGRDYSHLSIPGTGIYRRDYFSKGQPFARSSLYWFAGGLSLAIVLLLVLYQLVK